MAYAQRNVKEFGIKDEFFKKALVRPFDSKFTYFTNKSKGFIAFPVYDTMRHLAHQDQSKNLGLIIGKSGNVVGDMPWNLCFVTNTIVDLNIFYRGGGYVYPLYVDTSKAVNQGDSSTQELGDEKETIISNLNGDIIKQLSDCLGVEPSPEDLLDYIYAILHSSNYREKFKEQLKYQFPRIPYPQNEEEFKKLASLGNHLRHLHLMDNTATWNAKSQFPFKGNGSSIIVKPQWKDDKVYINKKLLNLQEEYFMKKFIKKITHTAKSAVTCVKTAAVNSMSAVLAFNRRAVCSNAGEGYIDTAVKVLIAVVLGALVLAGLYAILNDTVMPTVTQKITEMFSYNG